jgi:hypothetical protein
MGYIDFKKDLVSIWRDMRTHPLQTLGILILIAAIWVGASLLLSFLDNLLWPPQPTQIFTSTQTVGFMPPNNTINLDNLATLVVTLPNSDQINSELSASFLTYAVVLDLASPSVSGSQETYSLDQEYEFDLDGKKTHIISVEGKSFIVTLLGISQASSSAPIEYDFGILQQ